MISPKSQSRVSYIRAKIARFTASSRLSFVIVFGAISAVFLKSALLIFCLQATSTYGYKIEPCSLSFFQVSKAFCNVILKNVQYDILAYILPLKSTIFKRFSQFCANLGATF